MMMQGNSWLSGNSCFGDFVSFYLKLVFTVHLAQTIASFSMPDQEIKAVIIGSLFYIDLFHSN